MIYLVGVILEDLPITAEGDVLILDDCFHCSSMLNNANLTLLRFAEECCFFGGMKLYNLEDTRSLLLLYLIGCH